MKDNAFIIKDSGESIQFTSGMVRDLTAGKIDYSLAIDGPMFRRFASHMTKGAAKYGKRNWMKAEGQAELDRFKESAFRHFMQWYLGDTDEDHAAAVYFNINGCEYVKEKLAVSTPLYTPQAPTTNLHRPLEASNVVQEPPCSKP